MPTGKARPWHRWISGALRGTPFFLPSGLGRCVPLSRQGFAPSDRGHCPFARGAFSQHRLGSVQPTPMTGRVMAAPGPPPYRMRPEIPSSHWPPRRCLPMARVLHCSALHHLRSSNAPRSSALSLGRQSSRRSERRQLEVSGRRISAVGNGNRSDFSNHRKSSLPQLRIGMARLESSASWAFFHPLKGESTPSPLN
jgi:hypothetical protein